MQQEQDIQKPLEKFGKDLTDLASKGKLDPVIGRDEEIRRTLHILSTSMSPSASCTPAPKLRLHAPK